MRKSLKKMMKPITREALEAHVALASPEWVSIKLGKEEYEANRFEAFNGPESVYLYLDEDCTTLLAIDPVVAMDGGGTITLTDSMIELFVMQALNAAEETTMKEGSTMVKAVVSYHAAYRSSEEAPVEFTPIDIEILDADGTTMAQLRNFEQGDYASMYANNTDMFEFPSLEEAKTFYMKAGYQLAWEVSSESKSDVTPPAGPNEMRFDIFEKVSLADEQPGFEKWLKTNSLNVGIDLDVATDGEQYVISGKLALQAPYLGSEKEQSVIQHNIPVQIQIPVSRVPAIDKMDINLLYNGITHDSSRTFTYTGVLAITGVGITK